MFYSLLAVAFTVLIGSVSIRAWWIERKKRLIAEHGVIERPNSSHASKAVRNQEDEEWWRRIDLERLHELNREYVERLLRQIEGAGVGALTKDERAFMERMAELEQGRPGAEGRKNAEGRIKSAEGRIKSKVMILLTDGENNAGDIDPITAAKMAAAFDITVYTIGAGTDAAVANVPVVDPFTGRTILRPIRVSIDEKTLREIAAIAGGRYFRATDRESLQQVYEQIDALERTRFDQRRYTDYKEITVESVRLAGVRLPPLLSVVVVLIAIELVLANTRFRTIP